MALQSEDKVALVTGSATGIGRATALRFAKEGIAVVVNYSRSEAEAERTLADVKALGVKGILCKANIANEREVSAMMSRCEAEFGRLDVLVNNAATTRFIDHTNLDALSTEVWDDILNVNVKGTYFCCRAAMPLLQKSRGNIVNVTSVAGLQGQGSSMAYAASKAAVNCLTKSLARAFAPKVRVNAVAPGPVLTRWLAGREEQIDKYVQTTPLGRAATPEDIADAVAFLALGTTLMTGQVIVVDGGRTM
jgi:3-oxoacyl-[acyl-carrier protein] reductase